MTYLSDEKLNLGIAVVPERTNYKENHILNLLTDMFPIQLYSSRETNVSVTQIALA